MWATNSLYRESDEEHGAISDGRKLAILVEVIHQNRDIVGLGPNSSGFEALRCKTVGFSFGRIISGNAV